MHVQASLLSRRNESIQDIGYDMDRILHSKAFARYADKTQVVYLLHHDHVTYRGLHVQFVSALARRIGHRLGLSIDIIEAISLGHDIGHAPFGHDGEGFLSELAQEHSLGAFSHASQSCRLASFIEPLDLMLVTLDGMLCHDGGMQNRLLHIAPHKGWADHEQELVQRSIVPEIDLKPATHEAAVVKLADTISYLEKDIDDALLLGIIQKEDVPKKPFSINLRDMVIQDCIAVFQETGCVGTSPEIFAYMHELRAFNFSRIYCHPLLKSQSKKVKEAYRLLFSYILEQWHGFGKNSVLWKYFLHNKEPQYLEQTAPAQYVVDYISGMTDGYFLRLFHELFVPGVIEVPDVLPFCR